MITAQAPGKMILIGEYAVLEGAPALVCAMDCYAKIKLETVAGNEFILEAPAIHIHEEHFVLSPRAEIQFAPRTDQQLLKRLEFFKTVFEDVLQHLARHGQSLAPSKIVLDTADFYTSEFKTKFGFGSSAAMTVALFRVLLHRANPELIITEDQLFDLAQNAHRKAQGNIGSGIDIAASVYGGVLLYSLKLEGNKPLGKPQKIAYWDDLYVLPIWSGRSTSTKKMVQGVTKLKETKPALYERIMSRLISVSGNGCSNYLKKDFPGFCAAIKEYHQILLQLGQESKVPIISIDHQNLSLLMEQLGVVYKPSGAGGGDIGVAFAADKEKVNEIHHHLSKTNFRILQFKISRCGVKLN